MCAYNCLLSFKYFLICCDFGVLFLEFDLRYYSWNLFLSLTSNVIWNLLRCDTSLKIRCIMFSDQISGFKFSGKSNRYLSDVPRCNWV